MVKSSSWSLLAALFLVACAQVKSIPGGTKDTAAPTLLFCSPSNLSTHFEPHGFTMEWNEYLVLNNINQELVVSPPIQPAPVVKLKNKTISVSWTDTLEANTTYVFNFGAGVTDLTEGNKAKDVMYVFATGSQIDSLSLTGIVRDAWTNEPAKQKRLVMFHEDSLITQRQAKPVSIGLSQDNGNFKLPYLREGNYSLFVLDDANSNYLWDEGEAVGFLPKQVTPQWNDSSSIALNMSTPRNSKPLVGEYNTDSLGRISFAWDHYFKGLNIEPLSNEATVNWSAKKDSVVAWVNSKALDKNIELRITADTLVLDTISIKVFSEATKLPIRLETKPNDRLLPKSMWTGLFNQPIASVNTSKFLIKKDSTTLAEPRVSFVQNQLEVLFGGVAANKYTMKLLPGAITSIYGSTNDTLDFAFSVLSTEETGILNLAIQSEPISSNSYVVLLDNKQNEVFRTPLVPEKTIQIANIIPGEHTLKVIEDTNGNGIWDPANFATRVQPERVWTYGQKLNVRANWELNQQWKLEE
jgi:hypothetical protein